MKVQFSPSINIIRDFDGDFNYIPTPNAHRIYRQIVSDFKIGIHSFNIVGSYGTGKSAFLLAFEKTLQGNACYFEPVNGELNGFKKFQFVNIVGDYSSLVETIGHYFGLESSFLSKELVFGKLEAFYQEAQRKNALLVIVIDEFGKFLEYAAKNNPEGELYFIQQLAEYVADKNIILIATLHQGFDSYSKELYRIQRQEWEKVKGRLKEITFNEPVEQLLFLAAEQMPNVRKAETDLDLQSLLDLIEKADAFPLRGRLSLELAIRLLPLDLVAAAVLTLALQKYGQNERSLFSFLNSSDYLGLHDFDGSKEPFYNLSNVYDYLLHNYYSFISTKYNPHYIQWSAIGRAVERVEGVFSDNPLPAIKLVKTIGLLNIFCKESARINVRFLSGYARACLGIEEPEPIIDRLSTRKIIRHVRFKDSFILFDGTDLDIELAVSEAGAKIEPVSDVVSSLKKYFSFPHLSAKAAHYKYGTPRFFEFVLSAEPTSKVPTGEVDGVINLVFSENLGEQELLSFSQQVDEAVVFGFYRNTDRIRQVLHEIQKIEYVIDSTTDDRVAIRELKKLLSHQIEQLNAYVLNALYSGDVLWVFNGRKLDIQRRADFNALLSRICEQVYPNTPVFQNELVNRHKLSSSITIARKNFFEALLKDWEQEDLGFPKDRFPAEKTIYFSLLRKTGMHRKVDGTFTLGAPEEESFQKLWLASEQFLNSAKISRKNLSDFVHLLSARPFKLKHGFIQFWLPLFLFIKRDDFALFGDNGYIPFLTAEVIELILKKPGRFQIKTFDVTGVKLDLLNKYRNLLNKKTEQKLSNQIFIDTIKPFLTFYKALPEYTKKTRRLSKSALAIREAIVDATDPEKTFFESFPKALGYADLDLIENAGMLHDYVFQLQTAIRELRGCFDNLVRRIEAHFLQDLGYADLRFPEYRNEIGKRYQSLKQYLLLPYQKTFYIRLLSELDDRNAWVNSLVHALMGKSLDALKDEEEEMLLERFSQIFMELDNLCEISGIDFDPAKEEVLKLEMTSPNEGYSRHLLRLPTNKREAVQRLQGVLKPHLSNDRKMNIAVLTRLLKEELSDE